MCEPADAVGARLAAGSREHPLGEIERRHARATLGQPDRVTAGAGANVEHGQARDLTERAIDLGLLELEEPVPHRVVRRGPTVVPLLSREHPRIAAHRTTAGANARSSTRSASSFVNSIDVAISRKPSASNARATCSSYDRTGEVTGFPAGRPRAVARSRSRARSTSPSAVRTLHTCGWRSRPLNERAKARGRDSSPSRSADSRRIARGLPPTRWGGSYAPPLRLTSKSENESCSARWTACGVVIA